MNNCIRWTTSKTLFTISPLHQFDLIAIFVPSAKMCRMWQAIRSGVKWNKNMQLKQAMNSVNLEKVNSVQIQLDPFHHDVKSCR